MTLKIVEFIRGNPRWRDVLCEKPYCISVSRDTVFGRRLMLLKYDQERGPDFSIDIVRECRGLILDEDTLEPVCVPFFKFGNLNESYCPEIDWSSCHVTEKIDGSLCKIVNLDGNLLVSTNGTIDAFKSSIPKQFKCKHTSFGDLIFSAIDSVGRERLLKEIKPGFTYMFELTSPFNKIVVKWDETRIRFLGMRNNETLEETSFEGHPLSEMFGCPKVFPLKTVDECVKAAKEMGTSEEGFVVVDKDFNRIKIKSPTYVELHHLHNNGCLSFSRAVEIVRNNEVSEMVAYFPEFAEQLEEISDVYRRMVEMLKNKVEALRKEVKNIPQGRERAEYIKKNFGPYFDLAFSICNGKHSSVEEWLECKNSAQFENCLKHMTEI